MVEAAKSYHERAGLRLRLAVAVLARQAAIKATKAALRAKGLKLSHLRQKDIVAMAEEYLVHHPELIAEAKETALRWQAEGVFGKRGGIRNPDRRAS